MKKCSRRLHLHRETLHHLEARPEGAALVEVAGGTPGSTTNYWFCVTTTLGPPPSADTNCGACGTD